MGSYHDELAIAISAANQAQTVINRYFSSGVGVRTKADNTPVTDADVDAEKTIKSVLLSAFPDYGFYGEETGQSMPDANYLWLVDPIDGTKSFVRQSPYFSTQIALMFRGDIVVGVSNAPAMQEQASVVVGQGANLNGHTVRCRPTTRLSDAYLSAGNIGSLAADTPRWQKYARLVQSVARVRGYGDFYHYHQLASGQADIVIESDVNILDISALSLLITEAGGVFTDLNGNPVALDTTSVLAAATPELHADVLALLSD